ncbi:hypothetical protein J120_04040 [candidate division TM6 bacterium JCVI TM6SC1]|uniref:Uncharacterized protein n=1 Tax=candidate division TM6 bacterium JCVI TM6SC1 TaxID=1306947 RepID=A0A0D2JL26_9BACT|nr:hypothetical protein J120_04040 [candidate division TM6 bacterium JCVI TM6SC1]
MDIIRIILVSIIFICSSDCILAVEKNTQDQFLPDDIIYNEIIAQYASDMNTQALKLANQFPDINAISQAAREYIVGYNQLTSANKKISELIQRNIITNFINPLVIALQKQMQLSDTAKTDFFDRILPLERYYKLSLPKLGTAINFVPQEFIAALLGDKGFTGFIRQKNTSIVQQQILLLFLYQSYISLEYNPRKGVYESVLFFEQNKKIVVTQKQLNTMIARLLQAGISPDFGFNNNSLLFYAIDNYNTDLFRILIQNGASLDAKRYLFPFEMSHYLIDAIYNQFIDKYHKLSVFINLAQDKLVTYLTLEKIAMLSKQLKQIQEYQNMLNILKSQDIQWYQAHIASYPYLENNLQELINQLQLLIKKYF